MNFLALAHECAPQVAPATMAAIIRTESNFQPLSININTRGARLARQPVNEAEAIVTAEWLIGHGYNIDVGLAQVNSSNFAKYGLTPETAFDPCKNMAAAAAILHWNYQAASQLTASEQSALQAAISAYNTGSFTRGFSNGYVQKVVANAGAAQAGPVLAPIPLLGARAPKAHKHTAQARQEAAVVLHRVSEPTRQAQRDGLDVFGGIDTQSVMVYR